VRNALAVVMLAGCWTTRPEPRAPDPEPPPVRSSGASVPLRSGPGALPIRTEWEGHYFCTQGKTAMRLTVETNPGDEAIMVFEFGPLAENPHLPTGSYQLIGTHTPGDDGAIQFEMRPDKWIVQPPGYSSVSLSAEIDSDHKTITGRIHNPACGELEGKRIP